VVEIDLDEQGDPVITATLTRRAIKRSRRSGGTYHFNVGYELDCPSGPFTVWLSPHPRKEDESARPEQLRLLPFGDPDAQRLAGIRSDAEGFHSNYKRTLIVDRATCATPTDPAPAAPADRAHAAATSGTLSRGADEHGSIGRWTGITFGSPWRLGMNRKGGLPIRSWPWAAPACRMRHPKQSLVADRSQT
jgi:hypothetical protein